MPAGDELILPEPEPLNVIESKIFLGPKLATIFLLVSIVKAQFILEPAGAQSPPQLVNIEFVSGTAVKE